MKSAAGVHDVEGNGVEGRWVHDHMMACYHMEGAIEVDFYACVALLSPSFGGQVEGEGEGEVEGKGDCATGVFQEVEGLDDTQDIQQEDVSWREGSHHCNP